VFTHYPIELFIKPIGTVICPIRSRIHESEKTGGLKYFEIHATRERNLGSMDKIYRANRHGHMPEVKEEVFTHYPIELFNLALDQH
jgi:hypothetical protein